MRSIFVSGRIHRRGVFIKYSRSPLYEPELTPEKYRGGVWWYVWWFSPHSCLLCFRLNICYSCRGDSQGSHEFVTLVLPSIKPKPLIFDVLPFCAFLAFSLNGAPGDTVLYHRGGWPLYICIYSLRHFLTTKGALIDGDAYPPLPPLKWPQKQSKKC